jgi:hypothetical protein
MHLTRLGCFFCALADAGWAARWAFAVSASAAELLAAPPAAGACPNLANGKRSPVRADRLRADR